MILFILGIPFLSSFLYFNLFSSLIDPLQHIQASPFEHYLLSNYSDRTFSICKEQKENEKICNQILEKIKKLERYTKGSYSGKPSSICKEQENQESCNRIFEKITEKEIQLQQSFLKQSGGKFFLQDSETIKKRLTSGSENLKRWHSLTGHISYYSFITGVLRVKGKFVLQEHITVFGECTDSKNLECLKAFPEVFPLRFVIQESNTPEFPKGMFLAVGCWDREYGRGIANYEVVDLSKRSFQISTFQFPKRFANEVKALLKTNESKEYNLFIAPNSEYIQGHMLCPNRYFLNPFL